MNANFREEIQEGFYVEWEIIGVDSSDSRATELFRLRTALRLVVAARHFEAC